MSDRRPTDRDPATIRRTSLTLAVRLVDAFTDERPMSEYERSSVRSENRRSSSHTRRFRTRPRATRYPSVSLRTTGQPVGAVRNPSGFDLFLGVPVPEGGTPTLEVAGGDRYLDETLPVATEHLSPLRPPHPDEESPEAGSGSDPLDRLEAVRQWREDSTAYQEIRLRPSPAYRFPPGSTLVRGQVLDPEGTRLDGVTLTVDGLGTSTRTTRGGEFVLAATKLTAESVSDDGHVVIDGERPRVEVRHERDETDPATSWGTADLPVTIEEGATRVYVIKYEAEGSATAVEIASS